MSLSLSLSLSLWGCSDDTVAPSEANQAVLQSAKDDIRIARLERFEPADQRMARISREEIPGFAGLFMIEEELVMATTRPQEKSTATVRLKELFPELDEYKGSIGVKEVKYDFNQLRDWAESAINGDDKTITFLDVDPVTNSITVGTSDPRRVDQLRKALISTGIPSDALSVRFEEGLRYEESLSEYIRPIPGGMRIQTQVNGGCTMTVNVKAFDEPGYAVTASHCVGSVGRMENLEVFQPRYSFQNTFPTWVEVSDPRRDGTIWGCPGGQLCRMADAVLLEYYSSFDIDQDKIAWPDLEGSTYFHETSDVWCPWGECWVLLPPVPGFAVSMVGQSNGLQKGHITNDCVGITGSDGTFYPCMHMADYASGGGDSGAPITAGHGGVGGKHLYGIHSGTSTSGKAVFSDWYNVLEDFARDRWVVYVHH